MHKFIRNITAATVIGLSMLASGVHAQEAPDLTPDAAIAALTESANSQHAHLTAVKIVAPADIAILRAWIAQLAGTTEDKVIPFDQAVFFDEDISPTAYVVFWNAGKVAGQGPITKEQFAHVQQLFGTQQDQTKL